MQARAAEAMSGLFRRRRQLRVGVPAPLMQLSPRTGHGRVWCRVLAGLADRVALKPVDSPVSSTGIQADVWLADGHWGALNVDEPVVAAVHEVGWTTRELRSFLDPGFARLFSARTNMGVLAAARVLTPSESSRRQVLDVYGVPAGRVHTIPYGVDLAVFRPGLTGGRSRVGAVTATDNPAYVLFVATLHPRKNLAAVRQAVAGLAKRGFHHVLALVGTDASDRDSSDELRRTAEAELAGAPGRIVSLPGGEDFALAELMAGADAVCLPSFSEGFGLTALEAMACGTPVVVSDRGALPELVDGSGLIVPPTAAAVEEALVRIVSDASFAAQLRAAARLRAERFAWERTVDGWLNVLEKAASTAP